MRYYDATGQTESPKNYLSPELSQKNYYYRKISCLLQAASGSETTQVITIHLHPVFKKHRYLISIQSLLAIMRSAQPKANGSAPLLRKETLSWQ